MKTLNKVMIAGASLVLLTGCNLFMKETNYSDFHEKAVAAEEKAPEYKKATAKGTVYQTVLGAEVTLKVNCKFVKGEDGWEVEDDSSDGSLVASVYLSMRASSVGNSGDYTYYAGNGFKVTAKDEDSAQSYTFNSYGYVTSAKGKSDSGKVDLKFSWSK